MNIEQERKDFEMWVRKHLCMPDGVPVNWGAEWTLTVWEGWKARAALQSQDREDAERYRYILTLWENAMASDCRIALYRLGVRLEGVDVIDHSLSDIIDRTRNIKDRS